MTANRRYYLLPFSLSGGESWLIWWEDDDGSEGVVLDRHKFVATWTNLTELSAWAAHQGLALEHNTAPFHELEPLERWLAAPSLDVNCRAFLEAWNLFGDVARSTTGSSKAFEPDLGDCVRNVYEKVFFGNNLPAVTPPGEHYEPAWSETEIATLRAVMSAGLHFFRSHLGGPAHQPR